MNNKIIYYKDIFSEDFLDYFDDYKEAIGNIKLDKLAIDIHKIAKVIGFKIKPSNKNQSIQQQNFALAQEIGHLVLNHDDISNKLIDYANYSFDDSVKYRAANRFATLLLMPENLLTLAIEQYQKKQSMNNQELENSSANMLVKTLSENLNVPEQSMKWRLITLGVIE